MPRTKITGRPLVSFIVASYNYERFIGTTLKSILDQTVQDFEIVVVDDASTDASRDIVRSFRDPRIHLHVNDKNIGLVSTYNRAASLAKGEYITYLDSDDWIEPRKLEEQLEFFHQNAGVDIVGTYTKFIDNDGNRHPLADGYEQLFNQPHDFDALDTWVCSNKLINSSVMLPRSVHHRIGLCDTTMAIAADFELWTRAYSLGCRFGIVQSPLLTYRFHDDSAGQRFPLVNFLEISYLLQKNILPMIEARSALELISELINWHLTLSQFSLLEEDQRYRLLGLLVSPQICLSCIDFKKFVLSDDNPSLVTMGKRCYATVCVHPSHPMPTQLKTVHGELAARDRDIALRDNELAVRDREIAQRDTELATRDRVIAQRDDELAARDRGITLRDEEIAARDRVMKSRGAVARLLLQNIIRRFRA